MLTKQINELAVALTNAHYNSELEKLKGEIIDILDAYVETAKKGKKELAVPETIPGLDVFCAELTKLTGIELDVTSADLDDIQYIDNPHRQAAVVGLKLLLLACAETAQLEAVLKALATILAMPCFTQSTMLFAGISMRSWNHTLQDKLSEFNDKAQVILDTYKHQLRSLAVSGAVGLAYLSHGVETKIDVNKAFISYVLAKLPEIESGRYNHELEYYETQYKLIKNSLDERLLEQQRNARRGGGTIRSKDVVAAEITQLQGALATIKRNYPGYTTLYEHKMDPSKTATDEDIASIRALLHTPKLGDGTYSALFEAWKEAFVKDLLQKESAAASVAAGSASTSISASPKAAGGSGAKDHPTPFAER